MSNMDRLATTIEDQMIEIEELESENMELRGDKEELLSTIDELKNKLLLREVPRYKIERALEEIEDLLELMGDKKDKEEYRDVVNIAKSIKSILEAAK